MLCAYKALHFLRVPDWPYARSMTAQVDEGLLSLAHDNYVDLIPAIGYDAAYRAARLATSGASRFTIKISLPSGSRFAIGWLLLRFIFYSAIRRYWRTHPAGVKDHGCVCVPTRYMLMVPARALTFTPSAIVPGCKRRCWKRDTLL